MKRSLQKMKLGKLGTLEFTNQSSVFDAKRDLRILFMVNGNGTISSNNQTLKYVKDDLFVISSGKSASYRGDGYLAILSIRSDVLKFFKVSESSIICSSQQRDNVAYKAFSDIIMKLINMCLDDNFSRTDFYVIQIINLLEKNFSVNLSDQNLNLVEMVHDFIDSNYFEPLTLVDIAQKLNFSPQYVSMSFKKSTGNNVMTYLNEVRLKACTNELRTTKKSIVDIALDNGFSTVVTFNRDFKKKFDLTPTEYRKNNSNRKQTDDLKQQEIIKQLLDERKADGLNDIYVDVKPNRDRMVKKVWNDCYRFFKNEHGSNFEKEFSKINTDFVRYTIYESSVRLTETDLISIEKELDYVLRKGLKPIFDFDIVRNNLTNEEYMQIILGNIQLILKHFANIVSIRNISDWKIQFTIKDDFDLLKLRDFLLKVGKIQSLYKNFEKIIIASEYERLSNVAQINLDIDYSLIVGASLNHNFTGQSDVLMKTLIRMIKNLKNNIGDKKLYIEDLQLISSNNKLLNDTEYFSCAYVYFVLQTWSLLDGIEIPKVEDSGFGENNSFLNGQRGLFSTEGISKPIYGSISFLDKSGRYYIHHDEHNIVTFDGFNDFSIICQGYNQVSYDDYDLTYQNYQGIFKHFQTKKMHFNFSNIKNGTYRIKIRRINRTDGNLVHVWSNLNYLENLSTSELKYLEYSSQPKLNMKDVSVTNNKFNLTVDVSSNEVVYVHFIYRY